MYAGKTLYQGDIHAHADNDGKLNETAALNTWKTQMSEHALDFVGSLDHKQTNHIENSAWDKDLFLYGTEPGTYISGLTSPTYSATLGKAHYLMIMPDKASLENVLNGFSEFGYNAAYTGNCTPSYGAYTYPNFTKARFAELAQAVKAQGGLFVFAHPTAYKYSGTAEDYFLADGTALEVVYGSLTTRSDGGDGDALCRTYTRRNYELWKELLASGHKVWATSGSDIHGPLNDDGNPQVAEKALTSVYAQADTDSTNKAELITGELARGNFSAGSVGIKMCVGSTPMGGTTDFAGQRLVIEVGKFHQYVSADARQYRLDVYTDQGIVYSQLISNRDNAPIALDADESAMFYRVEIGDPNDGRVISYGNPIWNN
ncbi:MAG: hypothetical protein IJU18_06685 [Oscillospiraceae bacterium]|nr:hypothetical protein [Oscillospiraceae bacterium]